jgi:hypothetical protein
MADSIRRTQSSVVREMSRDVRDGLLQVVAHRARCPLGVSCFACREDLAVFSVEAF